MVYSFLFKDVVLYLHDLRFVAKDIMHEKCVIKVLREMWIWVDRNRPQKLNYIFDVGSGEICV